MTKIKGKVKAVSGPNEYEGVLQIGFVLVEDPEKWHNLKGDEGLLEDLLKIVKKGAEIEFDEDANKNITGLTVIKEAEDNNAEMTTFKDLLDDAHKKGLIKIETEMIQVDWEKQSALFKATVHGRKLNKKGEIEDDITCSAHGDTTQENTGDMVKKHWIRMAETRAIVRALRFFTNNAAVAKEETGE